MRGALAILTITVFGATLAPSIQGSYAQEVTIRTSSDDLGGTFFGEGVIQVTVLDPAADNSAAIEDIVLDIDADSSGSQGSLSVTVPETSESSGRFEFYIMHSDASAVDPSELDGSNSAGVEGDGSCVSDCAPVVTFGLTGDLQIDSDLYDEVDFEITADNTQITVKYEEDLAQVELDRSAYGSNSFVYVTIIDQDANLNPSSPDEFTVDPSSAPNSDLLELSGGSLESAVTFRETSDSSARFEGRYELGSSMTFDSEALVLTLFDKANYGDTLDADENDSQSTDEASFTIGNTDGTIGGGGQTTWDAEISSGKSAYVRGEDIIVEVEDPDSNVSPGIAEKIDLVLSVNNKTAIISATETGTSTGVFTTNLRVNEDGTVVGTSLKVTTDQTIRISYTDRKPADYAVKVQNGEDPEKEFAMEVKVLPGGSGIHSTTVSPPSVRNSAGSTGPLSAGSQVGIGTVITSNSATVQPYVSLVQVRDFAGITVYIAWQSGTLIPGGSSTIGVSWVPEEPGEYEVRTFAISSFEEAAVISELATSKALVS